MKLKLSMGYSNEEYQKNFRGVDCYLLKGNGVELKKKYDKEKNSYTNEVDCAVIQTYFKGMGEQDIKLPKDFKLSNSIGDMSRIELIDPEACLVGRANIYVRAKGIKEAD